MLVAVHIKIFNDSKFYMPKKVFYLYVKCNFKIFIKMHLLLLLATVVNIKKPVLA